MILFSFAEKICWEESIVLKHRYLCLFTVYNNIAVITNINYSILSIVISMVMIMMQHFNSNLIISLIMKLVTQLKSYYYCY